MARVRDDNDITDLTDELIDRFGGDVPQNVINLMHVSKIRALAAKCSVSSIIQHGDSFELVISSMKEFSVVYTKSQQVAEEKYKKRLAINAGGAKAALSFKLSTPKAATNPELILKELEELLVTIIGK